METNIKFPRPILFNCIKHHTGFIKSEIKSSKYERESLRNKIVVIGDSQMDLYFGSISPIEICNEVIEQLKENGVLEKEKYKRWLKSGGKDFQAFTLSDASVWTLRLADDTQRYVHIHPGRHSPQTVRVKANTLKTAIAVLIYAKQLSKNKIDVEALNEVRKEILGEPPVKSLEKSEGLVKILALLSE